MDEGLERRTRELAEELWSVEPSSWRHPLLALSRRLLGSLDASPALRSALFRFVDVAPACRSPRERGAHLRAFLRGVEGERVPLPLRPLRARYVPAPVLAACGLATGPGIGLLGRQFIVGRSVTHATRNLRRLWRDGQAFALDLLGEATVTDEEAEAYLERCSKTLQLLAETTRSWPRRPLLDADAHGTLLFAFEEVLADPEFSDGPSVGVVVQAYLRDADETLERILDSPSLTGRAVPATIRLVKGAYWDHEQVIAAQRGWEPPVWSEKRESDACFERLSRRLIDARATVRPAIATHNLRSLAHSLAYLERAGGGAQDLELQVLRGLGDETATGLARLGYRVRVYTPIGDLIAGMAYLVRRDRKSTRLN